MVVYNRPRFSAVLVHIIIILMLFIIPELMMYYSRPNRPMPFVLGIYFKTAMYLAVFYLNYFIIIRKTLLAKPRNVMAFVSWNLLTIIGLLILTYALWGLLFRVYGTEYLHWNISVKRHLLRMTSFMIRDVVMMALVISLAFALRLSEHSANLVKKQQQLEAAQREEELRSLRSQINPHFLFNTLNNIYALIDLDGDKAKESVHRLSKMLRYMLYENPATVHVKKEIDFVRNYLTLMEMRLPEGSVVTNLEKRCLDEIYIPPMLFIVLVENAVKHGDISRMPITIDIVADEEGTLTVRTVNAIADKKASADGGIGLANLRRRLLLIYGDKASLTTTIDNDIFTANLTIRK